jgi:hypothetical protein
MRDTTNIHGKALLVALSISKWAAKKLDRIATEIVHSTSGATDAGRFNKKLIARTDSATGIKNAYGELIAVLNAARADHYANSLAWGQDGWRLLPVTNEPEYHRLARLHKVAYATALPAFVRAYPELRDAAPAALGSLFKESEYPAVDSIESRFKLKYKRDNLPVSGDDLIDVLSAPQVAEIRAEMDERLGKATQAAKADARERIGDVVRSYAATMATPKGAAGHSFKDSKVANVRETVHTMRRLMEWTDDDEFSGMLDRIENDIAGADPQILRDDANERESAARKADQIAADMGALYGGSK